MSLFSKATPPAINTSAANAASTTPSLFGASASAAPTTSLFGQTTTTTAPATTSLFGQSTTTNTTTSAPAIGGGLFGQSTATTTVPATGGLFGQPAATTAAAPSTGLFGAPAASTAPATGGLFGGGGGTNTANPVPSTGGGLFGNTQQNTPQLGGSLFGNTQQNQQQPQSSLFGGQQQQQQQGQQQSQGGMFGGGGGGMFGQSQQNQQPQQQSQAVEMNFSNMRGTTRFEEMHQDVRNVLTQLDEHIANQIKLSQELSARSVGQREAMESVDADVDLVTRKHTTTNSVLITDGTSIGLLHNNSSQLLNTASLSTQTIDILRLPISQRSLYLSSHHTNNADYSLIPYFNEQADDMERKTDSYLKAMGEVERTLEGMERDIGRPGEGGEGRARAVLRAEKLVFEGMVAVAGRVAGVQEGMQNLASGRSVNI